MGCELALCGRTPRRQGGGVRAVAVDAGLFAGLAEAAEALSPKPSTLNPQP